jgi:LysM repeat protein
MKSQAETFAGHAAAARLAACGMVVACLLAAAAMPASAMDVPDGSLPCDTSCTPPPPTTQPTPTPPTPDSTPPAPTPPSDPTPTPPSTPVTEPTPPATITSSVGEPYSPPTPAPKTQPPATQPIDVIVTASISEWQPATWAGPTTDYAVQRGDTIFRIASRLNVPMDYLVSLNNLKPPFTLFVGETLIVPDGGEGFEVLSQPRP